MTGKKLRKAFTSRILYIIFSLLLSVVLWTYIEITENRIITKTVTIETLTYLNKDIFDDRGLVITDYKPESVELAIDCPRSVAKMLDESTVSLTVDLSTITSDGSFNRLYNIVYPNGVDTKSITWLQKSVERITFSVDKKSERDIRVEVPYNGGTLSSEYLAKSPEYDPKTITVTGPEAVLSQISRAVVTIMRENLYETYKDDLPYTLIGENNQELDEALLESLTCIPNTIRVTIPILKVKQIPLDVGYLYGAGATPYNVKTEITPKTITISGEPDAIESYNNIMLGTIDLSSFNFSDSFGFPIVVQNGFANLSGETEALVSVEVQDVEVEHYSVSSLHYIKEPPGLVPTIITQSLDVKIRGKREDLQNVTLSNIRVVADLSERKAGTHEIPAKVIIDGDVGDVGALGDYILIVRLDSVS